MSQKQRPRILPKFYGNSSSYHWVNDPFTDKLPFERHNKTFEADQKGREARNISKPTKGRAANL